MSFTEDQHMKSIARFKNLKDQTNLKLLKLAELTTKNDELDGKIKELESKSLYLEAYSRREKIKLENIKEESGHGAHQWHIPKKCPATFLKHILDMKKLETSRSSEYTS